MFLEKMETDETPANQEIVIRSLNRKIKRQQLKINYLLYKNNGLYHLCFKLRERLRNSNKKQPSSSLKGQGSLQGETK